MNAIERGIKTFGNAADLARATGYTPQSISIALKRMATKRAEGRPAEVPAGLAEAIEVAIADNKTPSRNSP